MSRNQVLTGVQSRISQQLGADLQLEGELKKAKAEGLHKIMWDPDASPEAAQRAEEELAKLYPTSKDLMSRIKQVRGKVVGLFKAPPTMQARGQDASQQLLNQAHQEAALDIDPNVADTYSNILPAPPSMAALAPSSATQAQSQPGTGVAIPGPAQPTLARTTFPTGTASASPQAQVLPPPPSMAQDINAAVRQRVARTKQDEVEKENRKIYSDRETSRIADDRKQRDAVELSKLGHTQAMERDKATREGAYHEPFSVTGNILWNQATGAWQELPVSATRPDNTMTEPELALIASDPRDPAAQARAKGALAELATLRKASQNPLMNELRVLNLEDRTLASPGQVVNRATGRPVNLAASEAVLLKDMKFLQEQTAVVDKLLQNLGDTGAIKGWITTQGMTLPVLQDIINPDQAEAAAEIQRLVNAYVYAMTGKQINENETVRLAMTAPNIRFEPELNRRMVRNFGRTANSTVDSFMEVNGWRFAPGVRGAGASAEAAADRAGQGATTTPALTPPPSTTTPGGTKPVPGTEIRFNGRTYVIQADGSAKEK